MLEAKLVVIGGDAQQTEVRLKQLPAVIGRGRNVTLTLPHPLVSRKHCEIFEKQGYLYVRDLQSLNGTYVNNTKIESERILEPNQLLTLGNVTFRAVYQPTGTEAPVAADANEETFRVTSRPTTPDRMPIRDHSELETERAVVPPNDTNHDGLAEPLETVCHDRPSGVPDKTDRKSGGPHIKTGSVSEGNSESEEISKILIEDEEKIPADKSVSLSALDGLPSDSTHSSFAGGIETEEGKRSATAADSASVQIETGPEQPEKNDFSESKLGSFIRKLPK